MECLQSAARALIYLSDTPANRLLLLSQGALASLALFIAPEYPLALRRASLRALHELTRGCSTECAREMSRSGALTQLGVLASGECGRHLEELALKTLANLCSQGCLRPLVGSLGVIQKFAEEVKKDPLKSGVFFKALCLCCREAVNRAKIKESGGLEVLISFLSAHQNHPLTRFAFLACVDFVYDESALEQLQELGLVPLLIRRLVELAQGEELTAGRMDTSLSFSSPCSELMTSCFDSFDFSALEGNKREDVNKDQTSGSSSFLSLRSVLHSFTKNRKHNIIDVIIMKVLHTWTCPSYHIFTSGIDKMLSLKAFDHHHYHQTFLSVMTKIIDAVMIEILHMSIPIQMLFFFFFLL